VTTEFEEDCLKSGQLSCVCMH